MLHNAEKIINIVSAEKIKLNKLYSKNQHHDIKYNNIDHMVDF